MVKVLAPVEIEGVHNVGEAAKLLGWGVATIWRRIKDGSLVVVHIGGRTLVPASEIERLQKERDGNKVTTK